MSNPNWKGKRGSGLSINKQLEAFDLDDCLTREQYIRGREIKETNVQKEVKVRRMKRK